MSPANGLATLADQRENPADLVREVSGLASPPEVCMKVMDMVQQDCASAQEFGEIIARDPSLTSRLLRLVNSSFFGLSRRVETVSRAISILGVRELYNLVVAVSAVSSFSNIPNRLVNMDTFWRHSLYTGLIARILAKQIGVLHPERLFIAGLLHDIGSLVLYSRRTEIARDLLLIAQGDEEMLCQAEVDTLGFSHADLGRLLLDQWRLPEALQEAVGYHHDPAAAESAQLEAALVHLANNLANCSLIGAFCEDPTGSSVPADAAWAITGIEPDSLDAEALIGEAGLQFTDTVSVMFAKPGD